MNRVDIIVFLILSIPYLHATFTGNLVSLFTAVGGFTLFFVVIFLDLYGDSKQNGKGK